MSSYVDREWFYHIKGRNVHLYQLLGGSSNERITQSGVIKSQGIEFIYPNENIEDGLRIEYTALSEPFISEALETTTATNSGITIAFVDANGGSDTMTDSASGFGDFANGDRIRVQGSTSNDGDYTLSGSASSGTLTFATATFTAETASERVTVTQIPLEDSSPSETSHPNLNRMLSLACVDYLKAMMADKRGDIQVKEYYMREFWKKVGDNESNKRKISMTYPVSPYAVR